MLFFILVVYPVLIHLLLTVYVAGVKFIAPYGINLYFFSFLNPCCFMKLLWTSTNSLNLQYLAGCHDNRPLVTTLDLYGRRAARQRPSRAGPVKLAGRLLVCDVAKVGNLFCCVVTRASWD